MFGLRCSTPVVPTTGRRQERDDFIYKAAVSDVRLLEGRAARSTSRAHRHDHRPVRAMKFFGGGPRRATLTRDQGLPASRDRLHRRARYLIDRFGDEAFNAVEEYVEARQPRTGLHNERHIRPYMDPDSGVWLFAELPDDEGNPR